MGCPGQDDQGSLDTGALSLVQEETAVLADFAQGVRRAREKVLREAQAGGGGAAETRRATRASGVLYASDGGCFQKEGEAHCVRED